MRRLVPPLLLLLTGSALAQPPDAVLTGTARSARRGVAGVTVTVTSPALQGSRTTTTVANGDYFFDALPPGRYDIQFAKNGFATVTHRGVLTVAQTARIDADLQPTQEEESITATGTAASVLQTPEIATTFDDAFLDRLPIRRGLDQRVLLAPGDPGDFILAPWSVDGGRLLFVRPIATYVEDSIEQSTLLSGALSPEWGAHPAAAVVTVTKSGGNDFAGSLRDTMSSDAWHGRSFEGPRHRSGFINHSVEATFGGRILPDRLWFFAAAGHWIIHSAFNEQDVPLGAPERTSYTREQLKLTAAPSSASSIAVTELDGRIAASGTFEGAPFRTNEPLDFTAAHASTMIDANGFVEALWGHGHEVADFVNGDRLPIDGTSVMLRGGRLLGGARGGSHEVTAGYDRAPSEDGGFANATFVNDRWHLDPHWSFQLGARYETLNADPGATLWLPRLSAIYDLHGDGHYRLSLSHDDYVDMRTFGPSVRLTENALGYAMQIGGNGFLRIDGWRRRWIHRGLASDVRSDGVELQGSYRFLGLIEAGGNTTWIDKNPLLFPTWHERANVWLLFNPPVRRGTLGAAVLEQVFGAYKSYLSVTGVDVTYAIPVSHATLFAKGDVMDIMNRSTVQPREFRLGLGARF